MSDLIAFAKKNRATYSLLMLGALVLTYLLYSQAFSAPWLFDDAPTFNGLRDVQDAKTAWAYIWGGRASEIGRPLANLSFLLNVGDWPENPAGFRRINTVLHLFNGLLLAWLAWRVSRLIPAIRDRAFAFSALLASLWLIQPLLFSATLMSVQRMTILSGSFTLGGLLLYVIGRERLIGAQWKSGLAICSIGLILGAGLGVFAKESAALLPFFVMSLELTVFRTLQNSTPNKLWKMWLFLFFALPAVLLLMFIAYRWSGSLATYDSMRDFNIFQRIASELVITWDYIRQVFIPNIGAFGPFHDDAKIHDPSSPQTLLAGAAWLLALSAAIAFWKKTCLPLFALSWFWAGHLLESTVIPLELYYEHRSYVAIIGLLAAVVGVSITHKAARWIPWILLVVSSLSLWRVTSSWSDPVSSGWVMIAHHPHSLRAAQYLAKAHELRGDMFAAYNVIDQAVDRMPQSGVLQTNRLQLSCQFLGAERARNALEQVIRLGPQMDTSIAIEMPLGNILHSIRQKECAGLDFESFLALTDALSVSPRISANPLLMQRIHHMRSEAYLELNKPTQALIELELAYKSAINPYTAIMILNMKMELGDASGALAFLDEAMQKIPVGALKGDDSWRAEMMRLRHMICENRRSLCEK